MKLNVLGFLSADPGIDTQASSITVLVGPNNSGKSLALREILTWASGQETERKVVGEIGVDWPTSSEEALNLLKPIEAPVEQNEAEPANSLKIRPFSPTENERSPLWVNRDQIQQAITDPSSMDAYLRQTLLHPRTVYLNGRARFNLMDPRPLQHLNRPPSHHLAALYKSDALRERVRSLVEKAFPGNYFVIDATSMSHFEVRMSSRPPSDATEEQGWDERPRNFHAAATSIDEMSDGVMSFTGLISAALSFEHNLILVDEPEAFLHPPLARLLGTNLAGIINEQDANLVAATHSQEFLMGCIDSSADTTVVRLTYDSSGGHARILPPNELKVLMTDPLLRSTKALDGLFHRGVVVGESDNDRALYEEINQRLIADGRGIPDTFFTSPQNNWQTIPQVIGPLRKLGVPAAAIMDLDTLMGDGTEWRKFYDAIGIGASDRGDFGNERSEVATHLTTATRAVIKARGLNALTGTALAATTAFISRLADYGVFIVPVGELEGWLQELEVTGSKGTWTVKMLARLGSDPNDTDYVRPGTDDIWAFLNDVSAWVANPERQGV